MRATDVAMIAIAAFAAVPAAYPQMKYVAVVETEVDAQSGASADLNPAEVRQITAELRREAVENLPPEKYSVMTSETVQAQGGAVLEECADENCVITLGSKIGADYIARGIISKFRAKFTLTVEMYETENGNLAAASDPVRYEDVGDLLEHSGAAVRNMYKKFVDKQSRIAAQKPAVTETEEAEAAAADTATAAAPAVYAAPADPAAPKKRKPTAAKPPKPERPPRPPAKTFGIGGGILYSGDFGGGLKWAVDGGYEVLRMPYNVSGAYVFLDAAFATFSIAYSAGGGDWETPNGGDIANDLPYMFRSSLNIGAAVKYTNFITTDLLIGKSKSKINIYPIFEIDGDVSLFGELSFNDGHVFTFGKDALKGTSNYDVVAPVDALNVLWLKAGGGLDLYLAENTFMRLELLYGVRSNDGFQDIQHKMGLYGTPFAGHGLTVKAGAGFKL